MYKKLRKHSITPIFLFQMGKVGSSSVRTTLESQYKGLVVHAHNDKMLTNKHKFILYWRMKLRLPIYVICPIRDPLSRNVSAFFQNFTRDTGFELMEKEWTTDELLKLFLNRYNHNVSIEWFDRHMRSVFGLDVYAEAFDVHQKWKVYKRKSVKVLVYRSDLDRSLQQEVISQFIGRDFSGFKEDNVTSEKQFGNKYKAFVDEAKLPDVYKTILCRSAYCRHFWSKSEIEAIRSKF